MGGIWRVSLQAPAIIGQHIHVPAAMVALLHDSYILVEPLSLLLTVISAVVWEVIQVRAKKVELDRHASTECLKTLQQISNNSLVVFAAVVAQEILDNRLQGSPCSFLLWLK